MAIDVWPLLQEHHGVVTRGILRNSGVTRGQIDRLLRNGSLRAAAPSVYTTPGVDLSDPGVRCRVATLHAGPGATVSHESAAWIWGLLPAPRPTQTIHVSLPVGRNRAAVPGVALHHRRRMVEQIRAGLPVRPVRDTLVDLAAHLPVAELRYPVMAAVRERLVEPDDLARAPDLPRRSSARWRAVVQEARAGAWSGAEATYWRGLVDSRLPLPSLNVQVDTGEGLVIVDALWPQYRLAVEVDGARFHTGMDAFQRDRVKDWGLYVGEGLVTLRVTAAQVRNRLPWVLDRTEQALIQRCHDLGVVLKYRRPGSIPQEFRC